jgi:hypothetical protein
MSGWVTSVVIKWENAGLQGQQGAGCITGPLNHSNMTKMYCIF